MQKISKKNKMTIDKLALITQGEFLAVRKEVDKGFSGIRNSMQDGFSTIRKEIVGEVRDAVREGNAKIIASNDKVVTKLDVILKEETARTEQYKRQERDITMLKQKVGI